MLFGDERAPSGRRGSKISVSPRECRELAGPGPPEPLTYCVRSVALPGQRDTLSRRSIASAAARGVPDGALRQRAKVRTHYHRHRQEA